MSKRPKKLDLVLGSYEKCYVQECTTDPSGKTDVSGYKDDGSVAFTARVWTCAVHEGFIDLQLAAGSGLPVRTNRNPLTGEIRNE